MISNFRSVPAWILLSIMVLPFSGRAGGSVSILTGPPQQNYPEPKRNEKLLFYVQRTHNRNTVIYELNLDGNGRPDPSEPLHASWIRYEENGVRKELSMVQKSVFGLDVQSIEGDICILRFKPYKKRDIYLIRNKKTGHYQALMKINGKLSELTSMFISAATNRLGIPSTFNYIDIKGIDPATGKTVNERIIPKTED